ncbi:protein PXR1-like [Herrania umbratica]|uniref:Protein PXR1-like n=1 Tax=Herrania umbratica TaxID=108875 RepID=A0A6J0ZXZ2_9ROSI|nr:protein PXR1-like [Herrania umbratica]
MKTVTGTILSSTPISVSKVTKIISNFAATDNGSSQAVSAYLRRASVLFNELKQLHRELRKQWKSDRKHKKSKSETAVEGARESSLEPSVFNLTRGAVELSQEASHGYGDSEGKKHKNKKKAEKGEVGNVGDGEGKSVIEGGESKRKKEKNEIAEIRAAEAAAKMKAEVEMKKQREREREAARNALQQMEKTAGIELNVEIEKEFEMLIGFPIYNNWHGSRNGSEKVTGAHGGAL